jgi:hypothetical protein
MRATEILDLVLLNIKPEKPLQVTKFKSKLREKFIETRLVFDDKSTYQIQWMTINEFNENLAYRARVLELFTLMYQTSNPQDIQAEFEDSFSNDDKNEEDLTLIFLVFSNNKIVGFTVYNALYPL